MSAFQGRSGLSFPEARWRKSTYSGDPKIGTCVEVAPLTAIAAIGVRDSKDESGPALVFGGVAWAGFLRAVKADQFPMA